MYGNLSVQILPSKKWTVDYIFTLLYKHDESCFSTYIEEIVNLKEMSDKNGEG